MKRMTHSHAARWKSRFTRRASACVAQQPTTCSDVAGVPSQVPSIRTNTTKSFSCADSMTGPSRKWTGVGRAKHGEGEQRHWCPDDRIEYQNAAGTQQKIHLIGAFASSLLVSFDGAPVLFGEMGLC